ncbi:MAG: DUF6465 family protein [Peptoniphilaceae bacterium]|nr:DUF6465 family protein [Peptoniphilaceae bacterium]MDY6085468.1 DUF6465 family protein [Peptoniphilaceae bacterium]
MTKTTIYVQYAGREVKMDDVEKQVKQYWKADGHKLGEMKEVIYYIKPEENGIYYSVNDDEQKGRVEL